MGLDYSQAHESRIIARGKVTFDATSGTTFVVNVPQMTADSLVLMTPNTAGAAILTAGVDATAGVLYVVPAATKFTITYVAKAGTSVSTFSYIVLEN